MKNKRGQFYIIAAIFILMILFGMTTVTTYAIVKPEPRTIEDLSNELSREGYHIVEHGIYNEKDLNVLIEQFIGEDIGNYLLKTTKNVNIVFVYGNREKVYSLTYLKANTGNIGVGGADWRPTGSFSKKRNIPVNSLDKTIELNIEVTEEKGTRNYKYLFDLRDNEMFYFVILKERDGEIFIERN